MELSSIRSGACTITECIQGKAGQILVQLSVLSGPWDIFKNLTTDQPKGQRGLIFMAEEEGKGKVKGIEAPFGASIIFVACLEFESVFFGSIQSSPYTTTRDHKISGFRLGILCGI